MWMDDGIKRLCMLLHAYSGMGKTPLSNTAPGPRLVIDVENGADWIDKPRVTWDGKTDPRLLQGLTDDTSVIVNITDFLRIKNDIMPFLTSGRHPFRSVILDSMTELQEKMLKAISGDDKRDWDAYGTLLIWCQNLLIDLKDLKYNNVKPVDCIIIVCGTDQNKADRIVPMLDGKISKKVTFKMDLVAYLFRELDGAGNSVPRLRIQPTPIIDAKDRTMILAPFYGDIIPEPDVMEIMRVLNTQKEVPSGSV
jgi:hypothetical protein